MSLNEGRTVSRRWARTETLAGAPFAGALRARALRSGALMAAALLSALAADVGGAQEPAPRMDCSDGWDSRGWRNGRNRERACVIRELTLPATGSLVVDAGPNGGVDIMGWERDEVLVRAKVQAWGADEQGALETAEAVTIRTQDVIEADGPARAEWWIVSYEIFAPRETDVDVETSNGGIAAENLSGQLEFEALNGGISLEDLAGNVRARTTNGGVNARLTGSRWDGEGIEIETTNGGVRLRIPENYSARLETSTVHGGTRIDFPVTVRGRIGREVSTTLGDGGGLVRASTRNGGVSVSSY
jgi:hypothetical protein